MLCSRTLGGSFFLLCWLRAFWWLFFWRKQPRLFCFAQGPLAIVFFAQTAKNILPGLPARVEMWRCGARQSHGKAQKKDRQGSIAKQSARKRPPESHRLTRKAKKKTAKGPSQSKAQKKTPESHRLTRKALCRLVAGTNILSIN